MLPDTGLLGPTNPWPLHHRRQSSLSPGRRPFPVLSAPPVPVSVHVTASGDTVASPAFTRTRCPETCDGTLWVSVPRIGITDFRGNYYDASLTHEETHGSETPPAHWQAHNWEKMVTELSPSLPIPGVGLFPRCHGCNSEFSSFTPSSKWVTGLWVI